MSWYDYEKEQERLLKEKRRVEEAMEDREIRYSGYIQASKDLDKINQKLDYKN